MADFLTRIFEDAMTEAIGEVTKVAEQALLAGLGIGVMTTGMHFDDDPYDNGGASIPRKKRRTRVLGGKGLGSRGLGKEVIKGSDRKAKACRRETPLVTNTQTGEIIDAEWVDV